MVQAIMIVTNIRTSIRTRRKFAMLNRISTLLLLSVIYGCSSETTIFGSPSEDTQADNVIGALSAPNIDRIPLISLNEVTDLLPVLDDYGDQGVLWGDFDNDQRADLLFMGHGHDPALYQQVNGSFVNRFTSSGIKFDDWAYKSQRDRHGASCADYDNDGNLDLFIGHGADRGETLGIKYDELLRGNGDFTFEDVTLSAGVLNQYGRSRAGKWIDVNNDGWLDLHIGNYGSDNVMYLANGDGTFTDRTSDMNLGSDGWRGAWSDFNNDGLVDLVEISPLQLFMNTSAGTFEDVTKDVFGETDLFGYGLAWADLDNDGDQDLLVSRLSLEGWMFENVNGSFTQHNFSELGINPDSAIAGMAPADMDNDGDLDLVLNTSKGLVVYENSGSFKFVSSYTIPRTEAIVKMKNGDISIEDFDSDGLLDVASDDPEGYRLFRNTTYQPGNWVRLKFQGSHNNRMGIGAKVTVKPTDDSGQSHFEYFGASAGLRSHGCQPLHIGIGQSEFVDIDVLWPNGLTSSLKSVASDTTVVVVD